MGTRDPRVDAYIAKSAEFARPILSHLRELVHSAEPRVEETMKWSMPHYDYKGMLCGMAAFKAHASFGFWRGAAVVGPRDNKGSEAMGSFGRITGLEDLPADRTIQAYVKKAAALNDAGVRTRPPKKPAAPKQPLRTPADLSAALKRNAKARATFEGFSPSHRREYIEWITEAKGAETRARRLATTLEWLAEGKSRNWKYMRKAKG